MAKDVRFNIAANPDQAVAAMKEMQARGEDVSKFLGAAFYQLGIKSEQSFEKQKQSAIASYEIIKASGTATWKDLQNAHAAMTTKIAALDKAGSFQESNKGAKALTQNIGDLDSSVNRLTGRFTTLLTGMAAYYVGGKIWQGFQSGVEAVDDFQMSVIQTAATITSLQGGTDIAENYRIAKQYAEGLQNTLIKVDANTSLNLSNLQAITFEMTKQQIVLDYNDAAQVESFTRIANAVAVYSKNGANEIQVRQEVGALLRGEVDMNSQLASMVQRTVDGPLAQQVAKWKQSGTLLEELGKRLGGFGEATKDIGTMWSSVKSSFETAMNVVLKAGFTGIVKDMSDWLSKINVYLKDHKDLIAGEIKQGWKTAKSLMTTVAGIATTIYKNFEPFAAFFVGGALLKGVFGIVAAMKTLGEVSAATRAIMLTTGMIGGGAGVAAAGGGVMAAMAGGAMGTVGAIGAGVGLGYAAQPVVRWADKKLYQNFGINLTGEAMYDESQIKDADATRRLNEAMARRGNPGAPVPKIGGQDTQEQIKEKIDLQEKELAAYKAMQDQKTSYAKAASAVELAYQDQSYKAGQITTEQYYTKESNIALEAAETKYNNEVDYYNREVDLLNFILEKRGANSKEYQAELAKNIKADEAVSQAEFDLQKTKITGETKIQESVRSTAQMHAKMLAQSQEESGQYVQAAETKIEAEKKTAEYLRYSSEEQALKEKEFSQQRTTASNKELEEARQYVTAIQKLQSELDVLNGKDQALATIENSLRDGRNVSLDLQSKLNLAMANGNTIAINGLSQQISLQNELNQKKAATLQYEHDLSVLTGKIVGFSNGQPIYASDATAGQYQYQSAAAAAMSMLNTSVNNSPGGFVNNNAYPSALNSPFLGGNDTTTVAKSTGKSTAKAADGYNTGVTITGNIILPNVTNETTARELLAELQKLSRQAA